MSTIAELLIHKIESSEIDYNDALNISQIICEYYNSTPNFSVHFQFIDGSALELGHYLARLCDFDSEDRICNLAGFELLREREKLEEAGSIDKYLLNSIKRAQSWKPTS